MSRQILAFLVITASTTFAGCGGSSDPTTQFKSFVAEADQKLKADKTSIFEDIEFSTPEFDVKQTDSTVSPYTAHIIIEALDKKQAARPYPEREASETEGNFKIRESMYDNGKRKFVFSYAFQDNKWVLKDQEFDQSGGLVAVLKSTELVKALKSHFTPGQ